MKKLLLFCGLLSLCTSYLFAQTSTIKPDKACINCPMDEPASSAVFEIQSTDKGILLPRMTTTERTNINSPADALLVYDTDTQSFWYYNASQWQELGASLSNQNLAQVLAEGNNANAFKIVNLSDPSNPQDAATKAYVDSNDDVDDADASPTNEIQTLSSVLTEGNDANNTAIANLADPSNPQDAATKAYVDASDEVDDADADPNNEFQDLSLSGDTLNLSDDATAVDLSAFINNWTTTDGRDAAFGYNNLATGDSSTAVGYNNIADTTFSSAFGYNNVATGARSSAFGYFNDATGVQSSAFGRGNEATGASSSAFGYLNDATGGASNAFGVANEAIGIRSSAVGFDNEATGDESSAFGYQTLSNIYGLMTVGRWNATPVGSATTWVDTDPVFIIGNGEDDSNRSTALTILKNGNIGIGTDNPQAKIQIVGGSDVDEVVGGNIILGSLSGNNIGIDQNEIQARDNGIPSDLYLQAGQG